MNFMKSFSAKRIGKELKGQVVAGEVEMTPTTGITTDKVNEIREAVRP